jgi:hypothetical protein
MAGQFSPNLWLFTLSKGIHLQDKQLLQRSSIGLKSLSAISLPL